MGRRISLLSILIPTFAAGTAAAAAIALFQLAPDAGAPEVFPLAQPHLDRAIALLSGPHGRERSVVAKAEAEARQALDASPARADAWLTLAYVEQTKAGGRFTPKVAEAVERSYMVGPLDPDVSHYRVEMCFNNWAALPKALKADVLGEVDSMWKGRSTEHEGLGDVEARLVDPAGRLALRVQLALLKADDHEAAAADE
jgi:hypothetical protein